MYDLTTYRNPYDPSCCTLGTFDAYDAEEQAQSAKQLTNSQEQLHTSSVLHLFLGPRAHGFPIEVAIWSERTSACACRLEGLVGY